LLLFICMVFIYFQKNRPIYEQQKEVRSILMQCGDPLVPQNETRHFPFLPSFFLSSSLPLFLSLAVGSLNSSYGVWGALSSPSKV